MNTKNKYFKHIFRYKSSPKKTGKSYRTWIRSIAMILILSCVFTNCYSGILNSKFINSKILTTYGDEIESAANPETTSEASEASATDSSASDTSTTDNTMDNTMDNSADASADNLSDTTTSQTWPNAPEIYAECGILIDATNKTILYDKNCHEKMYPASITKILTTLIALENGNLSDTVNFYHYDVFSLESGAAHIARQVGEELTLEQTLYGVMLASANECANATAEFVARKTDAFTQKVNELQATNPNPSEDDISLCAISVFADIMNERAKEAGATDSHFTNPSGLFDENHYTNCYDMAMITCDAVKNSNFMTIESNHYYTIPATNMQPEPAYLVNRHKMLLENSNYYYPYAVAGKTGYTDQSGNTLVTVAKKDNLTLISVIMKSNTENVYPDTQILLDYGFNNFKAVNVASNETKFSTSESNLDKLTSVYERKTKSIYLDESAQVTLPNNVSLSDCTSTMEFKNDVTSSNNIIGTLNYYYNDRNVGSCNIYADKSTDGNITGPAVNKSTTNKTKSNNNLIHLNIHILLIVIVIFVIIIFIILHKKSKPDLGYINKRSSTPSFRKSEFGRGSLSFRKKSSGRSRKSGMTVKRSRSGFSMNSGRSGRATNSRRSGRSTNSRRRRNSDNYIDRR